jgi:hypothetical protein
MSGRRPRLVALADSAAAPLIAATWGAAEASFLFVVPDVWLGFIALVAPRRLATSIAAALAGAMAGVVVLLLAGRLDGPRVDALIRRLPGIRSADPANIAAAIAARGERAFLDGPLRALPVKVYVREAQRARRRVPDILMASLLNRLARFVPVAVGFALLGRLGRPIAEARPGLVTALYAGGWSLFYALYWYRRRDPSAGSALPAGGTDGRRPTA